MNIKNIDKQATDNAIAQAILSYLFNRKLITTSEFLDIRKDLKKNNITVDNITLKSDICNTEV